MKHLGDEQNHVLPVLDEQFGDRKESRLGLSRLLVFNVRVWGSKSTLRVFGNLLDFPEPQFPCFQSGPMLRDCSFRGLLNYVPETRCGGSLGLIQTLHLVVPQDAGFVLLQWVGGGGRGGGKAPSQEEAPLSDLLQSPKQHTGQVGNRKL